MKQPDKQDPSNASYRPPKPDSREYVMRVVGASLCHAAQGDWDSYPRVELEPLSRADRLGVLATFDPTFGTKVAALKDVASLLPFPGRKKRDD